MCPLKKNGGWFIDYWHHGKRYRKKISPVKKQAEPALNKIKVPIAENKISDVKKQQRIRYEDTAKDYIGRYSRINKRSFARDETSIKHLTPFFGNKRLYEISPQMIEGYKAKRIASQCAKATVNRELALLKPIASVALNTGMRQGEILDLNRSDIDLTGGIITVRNTKNNERGFIPMNALARNIFESLKTNRSPGRKPGSRYDFPNPRGRKIRGTSVTHIFGKTVKSAGIADFRFHDSRHTFAAHPVMAGADITTVKELPGHKTPEMTLRYSHLSPDFKRSTVELLCNKMDTFWTLDGAGENNKKDVALKNPRIFKKFRNDAPIAQLVEQRTLNP